MLKKFLWLIDLISITASFMAARTIAPVIQLWLAPGGPLRPDWLGWLSLPAAYEPAIRPQHESSVIALIAVPVTVLALEIGRGRAPFHRQSRSRMLWECLAGPTAGLATTTLVAFTLHVEERSRALAFCFWGLSVLALLAAHLLLRRVIGWRREKGLYSKTTAVIGHREDALNVLDRIAQNVSERDCKLLGYYDMTSGAPQHPSDRFQRLGGIDNFAASLIHRPVNLVVIVEAPDSREWLPKVLATCNYFRLPVQIVSGALLGVEETLSDLRRRQTADHLPFAAVQFEPSELDNDSASVKRVFDIVISAIALVLLMPLFLLIAIAIKLTTPDLPVLYRYKQIGLHGVPFTAYKFTTMVRNAELLKEGLMSLNEMQGPVFKIKNDPRVTRLGKFLRTFSLNEFPQLWNVLIGDLSLVGPRAALPTELAGYRVWHKRKLAVRPGLTCLWQVSGRNCISSFDEWVRLDLQYIDTWSLWLDFKILARTAWVVLKGSGS